MSLTGEVIQLVSDTVANTKTLLILLPSQPSFDVLACAAAMSSALRVQGKTIRIVSPPEEEQALLPELQGELSIEHDLGRQNLVVSFDYTPAQVDKVSYNIAQEVNKFFLTIKPQHGQPPLDPSSVVFNYSGIDADALITIGIGDWEEVESLTQGYKEALQPLPIISLHSFTTAFGSVKLDVGNSACLSEAVTHMLTQMGWEISSDSATNLLKAISDSTHAFSGLITSAETFEAAAVLVRAGARRASSNSPRLSTVTSGGVSPTMPDYEKIEDLDTDVDDPDFTDEDIPPEVPPKPAEYVVSSVPSSPPTADNPTINFAQAVSGQPTSADETTVILPSSATASAALVASVATPPTTPPSPKPEHSMSTVTSTSPTHGYQGRKRSPRK